MNKKLFASLMMLLAAVFWGLSYSVQSLASELGSFTVTFFKCLSGLILLAVALLKKEKINKYTIGVGAVIGTFYAIGCIFQQMGLNYTTAANASFITTLYIVIVPVLSMFVGAKINKKILIGILFALFGMYFLCIKDSFTINRGDLLVLIGSLAFALQIIGIDMFINKVEVISFTAIQQLTAAIISGVVMVVVEKPSLTMISKYIPHLLFLLVFSGCIAQFIQNRFQRDLDSTLASLLMSFESVFGALFGWLILNQALSLRELFGCLLIFVGMIVAEL